MQFNIFGTLFQVNLCTNSCAAIRKNIANRITNLRVPIHKSIANRFARIGSRFSALRVNYVTMSRTFRKNLINVVASV
jgi:hypothetical protein